VIAQRSATFRFVAAMCAGASLAIPVRTISAGHPDLQGNWTNRFATPLERPIELRDRPLLTEADVAELNKRAARSFNDGHVMVVPSGRSLLALLNEVRIDDPTTWTRPWTAMVRLQRTKEQLYEFACHEGNVDIIKAILTAPKIP